MCVLSPCFQNQVQTRALLSDSFQTNAGEGGLISVITKDVAYLDTGFNSSFTKHCDCVLLARSLLLAASAALWLAPPMRPTAMCERLCRLAHVARNWERPPANSSWGTEAPVQQLARNQVLPTTTWVWAWKRILPSLSLRWLPPVRGPEAEDPTKPRPDSWTTQTVRS